MCLRPWDSGVSYLSELFGGTWGAGNLFFGFVGWDTCKANGLLLTGKDIYLLLHLYETGFFWDGFFSRDEARAVWMDSGSQTFDIDASTKE